MSDADNQIGGSGDPRWDKPADGPEPQRPAKPDSEKDTDVMPEDDRPPGGGSGPRPASGTPT